MSRVFKLDNLTVELRTDLEAMEVLMDLTIPTLRLVRGARKRRVVYVQLPLVYADTGEPIDA